MRTNNDHQLESLKNFYEKSALENGDGDKSAVWGSAESQLKRFEILSQIGPIERSSLLDVGCGAGDLYGWLKKQCSEFNYYGIDIAPAMIERARVNYPGILFEVGNALECEEGILKYDYVLASGIFNWRVPNHEDYVKETVRKMFMLSKKGVAFNIMSAKADFKNDDEYYADPGSMVDFCLELSRNVILRHDYMTHDFTIYIYR